MMHESELSRVVKMMIAVYFMALAISVGCYGAFEAPTGYPTLSVVCRIGSIALIVFAILLDAQIMFGAVRHRPESRSAKLDQMARLNT